ncbi:type II toxin-antitoxin system VapC family toxin [Streptomonospora nanhaiensis]|uniref:Putative nucleic acid-binding protein n=1 Tax=Streptomonospora nanhaiensis TaxID=1323731 RepID=A0A853BNG8_9ACTN|nr:type II toxin-antitoxin system VapC family toxin [Streptomonospora nanhaiensis]MBV2361924.1 type II toxin-antitoxin system VapC family toxin [Streptomonospora nanhaiensis]MBX9388634.1 type II toxin-antitoxin system VapC family toxin [Streptomonospora nanhaiensis]NYI96255.1 putative nucleic acid-binding protein [Streptomonospora nanhaiensis]
MKKNSGRVYIDSDVYLNVILGAKDSNPERFDQSFIVIDRGERGEYDIVASSLIYAEVACAGRLRSREVGEAHRVSAQSKIREWFTHSGIQIVSVDRFVVDKAIGFSRSYGLKSNDAIHLASAVLARCSHLFSWNKRDFPMGQEIEGVLMSEPHAIGQQEFDIGM